LLQKAKLSTSYFKPNVESYYTKIRHLWFLLTQAAA